MRDEDEVLRRYLLGEMETEEEDRLEARLIEDPELFEQAEAVEADLLDEYAHGEIFSASQRSRLQRHLAASPATRSQLAMVRAIDKTANRKRPRWLTFPWLQQELSSPWFRTLAAAMLTIAVLSAGIGRHSFRLQNDIAVISQQSVPFPEWHRQQMEKLVRDSFPGGTVPPERPRIPPPPPPPPVVVQLFQLALSATRSMDAIQTLRVQPETGRIDFRFPLLPGDETYASYQVSIQNSATSEKLINQKDLHAVKDGELMVLLLSVEAKKLRPGQYQATVQGISAQGVSEELGYPQFQVAGPEMNPQG